MKSRIAGIVFCVGVVMLLVSAWRRDDLPPAAALSPASRHDPLQTDVDRAPFEVTSGDVTYRVRPLYRYELTGLVVSMHDTATWWDTAHREWKDTLNVADLCVVWGINASSGAYARASFSSSQYTCWATWSTRPGEVPFDATALSNNHLLTAEPRLASLLGSVRVGDEVHLRGWLAEYEHDHGFHFHRGTSTARGDTGDHACETVFLEDFDVVSRGGGPWRALFWVGLVAAIGGLVGWFAWPSPVRN